MPASAHGILQNIGDTLIVALGNTGVGQPQDPTCVISLTGTFTACTVAVEVVAQGQALTLPATQGLPPTPASPSQWTEVGELNVSGSTSQSSPIGPLTSSGAVGSGFAYVLNSGSYSLLQLRLVSTGGGAINAAVASIPFPASSGGSVNTLLLTALLLEQQRTRIGLSILLEGVGLNLQDLTAADCGNLA